MESQRPDSGDLTETQNDQPAVADDAAAGDDSTGDDGASGDAPEPDAVAKPRGRRSRRLLAAAAAVPIALFVSSAAFAGAMAQPYLVDRALVATKLEIVRTATNAITTLWNYTPENMDTLADRAAVYLSGDLEVDYRKFIDAIATTNKQAKVTDTTEITGAAVETLDGSEATVLVFTNTSATSEATKAMPSLKYLSYRLSMRRDNTRWVITKMPVITSLDLTPRL